MHPPRVRERCLATACVFANQVVCVLLSTRTMPAYVWLLSFVGIALINRTTSSSSCFSDAGAVVAARAENLFALSNFKVDKFSVDSDNVVGTEFSLAEAVKATKISFTAEDAYRHRVTSKQGGKADFTVEHKAAHGTVTAVFDVLGKGAKVSAVGGHNGIFAGASAQFTQASFPSRCRSSTCSIHTLTHEAAVASCRSAPVSRVLLL